MAKDWKTLLCVYVYACSPTPTVCLCLWRGVGGFEVNGGSVDTSMDEMADGGRWGYLAFPAPAYLLVPNELSDSINERTESIIIIISKEVPGSKQLPTLAELTLVAPFDQWRQQGW